MNRKPKVFILGISGFIGYSLAWHLKNDFLVSGACFRHETYIPDTQIFPIDINKPDILETVVRVFDPDFIVNCIGLTDLETQLRVPKLGDNLNVLMAVAMAGLASKMRRKFIHLSCSLIYDGVDGNYREEDNDYSMQDGFGKQKVAAESYIRTQTLESTILRIGKVVGLGHAYQPSYFDQARAALAERDTIEASKKQIHSYISIANTCHAISLILRGEFPGKHRVFNVGGPGLSEYDFFEGWAKLVGASSSLIKVPAEDTKSNRSMISKNLEAAFPEWKCETKEILYGTLLRELSPGLSAKKWQKTLQIP